MLATATNWNAIGALAGVAGVALVVLGFIGKAIKNSIIVEVQKNQAQAATNKQLITEVKHKVTTPGHGTLGDVVARIEEHQTQHDGLDDQRFNRLWSHLGVEEPK